MKIEDIWAEIESEQTWRENEIRFFQNQLNFIEDDDKKSQFRKALILVLYAHFEGFCKFAFTLYVSSINSQNITCGEVNHAIAAASLSDLFQALRDSNSKCAEFRSALPDDNKLHRFARDREFIMRSNEFAKRKVAIPDNIIDTESNLKPVVLRKNLYRLGFPHDKFRDIEGHIDCLLNYRNGIAHGDMKMGIMQDKYEELRSMVFKVMNEIKRAIMQAIQDKEYLK